ncbi:MAG: GDSL-type esterase/lipase family protein [Prolixibacteraceae bacterium]|jgi:lysophospholipase L1-like esterase/pimeloyl-ACP methyl ester carboxylesterase|nr:GDSL-type esterase/lipase family protein [Prolixibacteraceae bacterium]
MKSISLLLLFLFLISAGTAQPIDPSKYSAPVKVACIGNSITKGSTIPDRPRDSYPSQLQRMLGKQWIVRNFGIGGRTMLKKGDYPYWNEEAYVQAKAFLPDVVIIKLGTNDTKPQNWKYSAEFFPDYQAMINELRNLPSHPRIYLCKPVPAYAKKQFSISDSIVEHGVLPLVERLAKKEKLPVIDLFTALSGKEELFKDKIHPNAEGAGLIAKAVYKALTGTEGTLVDAKYPGDESKWHGFTRYDFYLDLPNCHLIIPQKAAPGKPWVWRARFPEWHYQMDSILISQGFHVAYVNTDGMFGSPKAMQIWDNFYKYLTEQYGLNKKVALEGVSRGGLFVFGFAKRWPERVSCIYAEAPVCDIKSWPGGKGSGEGDLKMWQKLIEAYSFSGEKEALEYNDNPIDKLEKLAAAKVPLFFSIGLNDSIVPPEENTYKLLNNYIRLGGPATVYPNTLGKQTLKGHHFPIDNLKAGADFIRSSYPEVAIPQ